TPLTKKKEKDNRRVTKKRPLKEKIRTKFMEIEKNLGEKEIKKQISPMQ
ncbi:18196_t:CDS:1, partial [Gigaspora rosea]